MPLSTSVQPGHANAANQLLRLRAGEPNSSSAESCLLFRSSVPDGPQGDAQLLEPHVTAAAARSRGAAHAQKQARWGSRCCCFLCQGQFEIRCRLRRRSRTFPQSRIFGGDRDHRQGQTSVASLRHVKPVLVDPKV